VSEFNEQHLQHVKHLEDKLGASNSALAQLVRAIEEGGAVKALAAAAAKREAEIDELGAEIENARAQVQPVLKVRPTAEQYVHGSASLWTDDRSPPSSS
jgi:septal ring factor EnvC (AmiA/AmiB activator)